MYTPLLYTSLWTTQGCMRLALQHAQRMAQNQEGYDKDLTVIAIDHVQTAIYKLEELEKRMLAKSQEEEKKK